MSASDAADAPALAGAADGEDREVVRALERGLAVIRCFDAESPRLALSEVARRAGLSRASARRFLRTLESIGYVRRFGSDVELTPRVLELGFAYLSALTIPEVAAPHLQRLSSELGESSSLAVLDGTDVVYVARAGARRIMSVAITVGTRFPSHATSMGRVLLADLGPAERAAHTGPLLAHTPRTLTDPVGFAAELDAVRTAGYSVVDQELELGLFAVAAPVRHGSRVVAAVNVSTPAVLADHGEVRARLVPAVTAAARAISRDLDPVLRARPVPEGTAS